MRQEDILETRHLRPASTAYQDHVSKNKGLIERKKMIKTALPHLKNSSLRNLREKNDDTVKAKML